MEYDYSPIIGQQYCLPYPTNLAFTTKIAGVRHGELAVIDVNGNPLFWFDGSSKDNKWILVDAISSCTLISMREKVSCFSWSSSFFLVFDDYLCYCVYMCVCVYRIGVFMNGGMYSEVIAQLKRIYCLEWRGAQLWKFILSWKCFLLTILRKMSVISRSKENSERDQSWFTKQTNPLF